MKRHPVFPPQPHTLSSPGKIFGILFLRKFICYTKRSNLACVMLIFCYEAILSCRTSKFGLIDWHWMPTLTLFQLYCGIQINLSCLKICSLNRIQVLTGIRNLLLIISIDLPFYTKIIANDKKNKYQATCFMNFVMTF